MCLACGGPRGCTRESVTVTAKRVDRAVFLCFYMAIKMAMAQKHVISHYSAHTTYTVFGVASGKPSSFVLQFRASQIQCGTYTTPCF